MDKESEFEKQFNIPCPVGYHEHANIQGCHPMSQHHRFEHRAVGAGSGKEAAEYTFQRPESEEEEEQLTDITIPAIANAHGISLSALWENLKNLYGKKLEEQKYQEQKYTQEGKLLTYSPIHLTPSQIYTAHFLAEKIKRRQLSRPGKVVSIKPAAVAKVMLKQFPWIQKSFDLEIRKSLGDDIKLSVKAIIEDEAGRLLILKDRYSDFWDLPGGHVADGESLHDALVREVKEETNLDVIGAEELFTRELTLGKETKPVVFYKTGAEGIVHLSKEHNNFRWINQEHFDEYNLGVFSGIIHEYFTTK
ncbi:NUDIX hydrolase [Candidatus Daviesbacteria bacterium]|nr:NUDIX hydrolase [Candidatus Daviesbacteria bacterium]